MIMDIVAIIAIIQPFIALYGLVRTYTEIGVVQMSEISKSQGLSDGLKSGCSGHVDS